MSKPSDELPPKVLDELYRDGVRQWLGSTHKEIANKVEREDEMLHPQMQASYLRGEIALPAGRPKNTKRPNRQVEAAYHDFCQRRAVMKAEGRFYGQWETLVNEVAEQHGIASPLTLRNYIKRGEKAHK